MKLIDTMNFDTQRRPLVNFPSHRKIVCVDFDGVLSNSVGPYWPGHFGTPIEEGLHLLSMLMQGGYKVVILTARKETDLVALWLRDHGFPGMFVTNHKVPALMYVDDRALRAIDGFRAENIFDEIKRREHSNKEV